MKNFLLVIVCVVLGVAGQLLLKHGMSADKDAVDRAGEVLPRLIKAARNPAVVSGFALYFLSAALWLIVLTRAELSWAYPLLSLGYVVVVLLSRFLFHESVSAMRLLGAFVVVMGVWLISRS